MADLPTPVNPNSGGPPARLSGPWLLLAEQEPYTVKTLHEQTHAIALRQLSKYGFEPAQAAQKAEDLAQSVLFELLMQVDDPGRELHGAPVALATTYIVHACQNLRRERKTGRFTGFDDEWSDFETMADSAWNPEMESMNYRRWQAMIAAIEYGLKPACREVLKWRYFQEFTYEEISEIRKNTVENVRDQAYKCRGHLKKIAAVWLERLEKRRATPAWWTTWKLLHAKNQRS
jgi:RNA polymerase sigma factor (sigma-70 family)